MLLGRRRGRILAVKLGFNPNSSSLGVDVTFLLFGLTIVALLTPMIAFLLRLRARARRAPGAVPGGDGASPRGDGAASVER